jgi:S1-C subfamily serine protease
MRTLRACTYLVVAALAACAPAVLSHPSSAHRGQRLAGWTAGATADAGSESPATQPSGFNNHLQVRTAGQAARASVVDIHLGVARRTTTAPVAEAARDATRLSTGSGVVIGSNGLILTNEHVIRNARALTVSTSDGTRYPVVRTAVHARLDLAVLKIDVGHLPALPVADYVPRRGDLVAAVGGASFREADPVRHGMVTHTEVSLQRALDRQRTRLYENLMESTTPIEPGFSGGALVDAEGNLVGLNVAVSGTPDSPQCRGYAIIFGSDTRAAIEALVREVTTVPSAEPVPDSQFAGRPPHAGQ